ncbi:hypothetical protein [Mucilaginibacter segetis]|uniref:YdhG-like domain-containing protein n=1 Tax=Mucilaginibacter segetis TaxID=2793071 RepID=A0A934PX02_9SPHI|nr:hypothetical protein [Mucilaginibacter segetis]MBK0380636.1 hypothetical protein [Mucilaginibacter segetis]
MSKDQTTDLLKFLQPFGEEIAELVLWLRGFVWDRYPTANELIYDNDNELAFGWSPTERMEHIFCKITIGRANKNIQFGFYWGSEIADPKNILIGEGKQYRYLLVKHKADFPQEYISKLMAEAYINSLAKIKNPEEIVQGFTITKAVSAVKYELKEKDE